MNDRGFINISQRVIRPKIRAYLTAINASAELINRFKKGYCSGLATLAIYGLYLQSVATKPGITTLLDDWISLKQTLTRLSQWDENLTSLEPEDRASIERLIMHMEFIQHISSYLNVSQGEIHKIIEDTFNRKLSLEYTLAGLFTADDFLKPIELEIGGAKMKSTLIGQILLYNKRMILISCGKHTLGVFKNYGEVFMYNANHKAGMQTFRRASVPELIDAIFRAYKNAPTHHAPFGFRIFTGADTQAFYPEQAELLAAIAGPNSSLSEQATRTHSAIHIAARIGATESLRYYLGNNAEIDSYSKARRTPLYVAAAKGHLPAVALIMEFGADMHKLCRHDKTPFIRAAENNHLDIVEYMLGNQSSSTFKDLIIALTHLPNVASRQQLIHRAKPGKVEKFLVKSKQESLTFFAKASKVSAEVKVRRKIMQPQ